MTAVVIQMPRRRCRKRRFEVLLLERRLGVLLPPLVVWTVPAVNEDDAMAQARKIAMPRVDECFARPA